MKNSQLAYTKQRGFNLLEVLIAVVVLAFGLLGIAGLQMSSLKTSHNSYQTQQATFLMHEMLERMRSNRAAVYAGSYNVNSSYACNSTPPDCSAGACSQGEMARSDIYAVICGTNGAGGIKTLLVNGSMTITCPTGDCEEKVKVSVDWLDRALDSRTNGNQSTRTASIFIDSVL